MAPWLRKQDSYLYILVFKYNSLTLLQRQKESHEISKMNLTKGSPV
jgi:hypothetical protein